MKQIMLFLLLITGINSANAQFEDRNAIYFTNELSLGNYIGIDFNLNYVYLEKYSVKMGYSGHLRKAKSRPPEYSSGLIGAFLYGLANPFDQMENYQIAVGKIYRLNESGTIRANVSLGLGYTIIREPENWQRVEQTFLVENYTWNYGKFNTISLIVNPKIEFPFTRFYGLTISPMLQINKDRTYFGIGLGHMMGLLRKRKDKTSGEN